jgi:hypothetical protein
MSDELSSNVKPPASSDEETFEEDLPPAPPNCRVVAADEPVVVTIGGEVKLLSELTPRELSHLHDIGRIAELCQKLEAPQNFCERGGQSSGTASVTNLQNF